MKRNFGKRLASLFRSRKQFDADFFENLEDLLIEGDLGAITSFEVSERLQEACRKKSLETDEAIRLLKDMLGEYISVLEPQPDAKRLNIMLILGVNGVGKTTTIAKLAHKYQLEGFSVVMSAADTFRAAAIDQLKLHAERTGTRIVCQNPGADPGAVIFDTITSARAKDEQVILADTAGRMHTKENLLRELQKIDKVIRNRMGSAVYRKLLVIDSTTGQNGVRQAELFNQAIGIDGIILTKYDSAAKGGSIIQIGKQLKLPIAFIGVGEGYDDLIPFDKEEFLQTLLGM